MSDFISRDPTADVRTRRGLGALASVINSLFRSGQLRRDSGGEFVIVPPATAVPSVGRYFDVDPGLFDDAPQIWPQPPAGGGSGTVTSSTPTDLVGILQGDGSTLSADFDVEGTPGADDFPPGDGSDIVFTPGAGGDSTGGGDGGAAGNFVINIPPPGTGEDPGVRGRVEIRDSVGALIFYVNDIGSLVLPGSATVGQFVASGVNGVPMIGTAPDGFDLIQLNGGSTGTKKLAVTLHGQLNSGVATPSALTGATDDYDPVAGRLVRLSATGAVDLTGWVSDAVNGHGTTMDVVNVGSNAITLKHQSGSSSAANRFLCPGAADVTLDADEQARLWYDLTTQRWRVFKAAATVAAAESWTPYPAFTPGANDDEFDDGSFSGWTAVNDGVLSIGIVESNDAVSLLSPGGGSAARIYAYMKTDTVNVGDQIEICFRMMARNQSFNLCGLIFANGTTYGSGAQNLFHFSQTEGFRTASYTNYNTQGTAAGQTYTAVPASHMFLRLRYNASNSFVSYVSADGVQWATNATHSTTLTPSAFGFFISTWNGTLPAMFNIEYFRKT